MSYWDRIRQIAATLVVIVAVGFSALFCVWVYEGYERDKRVEDAKSLVDVQRSLLTNEALRAYRQDR